MCVWTYEMRDIKIIIIGNESSVDLRHDIINAIVDKNSDVNVINSFTCDEHLNPNTNSSSQWIYYIPFVDVKRAFQNNACVFCRLSNVNDETTGIMVDEFENGDIAQCSFKEFNSIFSYYIEKTNLLCVQVDSKNATKSDVRESLRCMKRMEQHSIPCMYFNIERGDTINGIAEAVCKCIESETEEELNEIIEENN